MLPAKKLPDHTIEWSFRDLGDQRDRLESQGGGALLSFKPEVSLSEAMAADGAAAVAEASLYFVPQRLNP